MLELDLREFEKAARAMGAARDQVPYALSRALNEATQETRQLLINDTWPRSVTVRNKGFLRGALRTEFSHKNSLKVAIFDKLNRGNLKRHADGGVKVPASGRIAVPSANVTRGSRGVTPSQKPKNLSGKVVIGNRVYQEKGRGKNKRLVFMYALTQRAVIKKRVPFREDFEKSMVRAVRAKFGPVMVKAMSTRR